MKHALPKPVYSLLAAALLAAIVMPIAFAGDSRGAQPLVSSSIAKQLKKLKQRIATLEGRQAPQPPAIPALPATLPPSGPAGGDLTGSFPNPQLGPNSVGAAEIAVGAVGSLEIEEEGVEAGNLSLAAVTSPKLANDAVQTQHIADGGIFSGDIATAAVQRTDIAHASIESNHLDGDSVGGSELKGLTTATSAGVTVNAGTPQTVKVTCPGGGMVIGGGYAWQQDEANSIIADAPSEMDPNRTWEVRGMVAAGSNTLYAWANCLAP